MDDVEEKCIIELNEKLAKKQKIISSLTKHIERLTNLNPGIFNEIQTTSALEASLHQRESALKKAMRDVSTSKGRLESERAHTKSTLESLQEGVITINTKGLVTYLNPAAENLLLRNEESVLNKSLSDVFLLVDEQTRLPIPLPTEKKSLLDDFIDIEIVSQPLLLRDNDTNIAIEWAQAPILNNKKESFGTVITFRDITDAHNLKLQLKHQATHDGLTGLLNRSEFDRRLANLTHSTYAPAAVHTLIYIDLDQFKIVNDTCGHHAGDELLRQLASIISPKIRGRDTLARLGGDEFAVLLENCPRKISIKIAQSLLRSIQDFRFLWEETAFDIGASMGLVYFSSSDISANDPLSIADAACYKAKELGRNRIHEVDTLTDYKEEAQPHSEMEWVNKITKAIDEKRFALFQQTIAPTSPLHDEKRSYEILIRMLDEEGNIIPPGAFLPAAERYGIISKIDRYVVEQTFRWLHQHPKVLNATHQCSINLSGPSLTDITLPEFVADCFKKYRIPFEKICFEITETSVIQNLDVARKFMSTLQKQGCIFALDDFGTGMSSFSYLKQLPVNKLKIDGTFVRDIATDPIDLAMTRSINDIGHVMGMQTIAEFVEGPEILALLENIGVDYVQGYHIAKPEPMASLIDDLG